MAEQDVRLLAGRALAQVQPQLLPALPGAVLRRRLTCALTAAVALVFGYCLLILPAAVILGKLAFAGALAGIGSAAGLYLWWWRQRR